MTPDEYTEQPIPFVPGRTEDVQRWADAQMYKSEPIKDSKPTAHLIWATPDPLGAMAVATGIYQGKVFRSLTEVNDDDRREAWDNMLSTHLTAGLEIIEFQWMFEGVPRWFTAQLERQRTAVYFEESLRFAVKETLDVYMPPSIAELPGDDWRRRSWVEHNLTTQDVYYNLVENGIPAEDARGLLPLGTRVRVHYKSDLRNMKEHAGMRLCTQAQFLWRDIWSQMVGCIRDYAHPDMEPDTWQWQLIADSALFRPACYQLGHCPFKASFDRACTIRERVDVRAKHGGVDSGQWHKPFLYYGKKGEVLTSEGINPAEWLLDPTAARK